LASRASLLAQESFRPSEVSEAAAELRNRAPIPTDYNLEIGPVLLKATGGVSFQVNDNITLSQNNREADILVGPTLNLNLTWPVTRSNSLTLVTAVGYQEYLFHPQNGTSSITVSPNSQLSFDIYTGDIRINLHDQFSVGTNPINQGDLANIVTYVQYTNTIGAGIVWDLQAAVLSLDLNHTNVITPAVKSTTVNIPDDTHTTESAGLSVLFPVSAILNTGFNANTSYTSYAASGRGSVDGLGIGPFLEARLTRYTRFDVSGGYQATFFHGEKAPIGVTAPVGNALGSYYVNVSIAHQLNRFYAETLAFGRQTQLGIVSQQEEYYYLAYQSQWKMSNTFSLGSSVSFNDVQEFSGQSQHYDQLVANVTTGWQVNRKSSVSLSYQFSLRLANVANQGYVQNALTLQFAYSF